MSQKIKILFLSWRDIKNPKRGGAEVFTHEMLKNIDHGRFEIVHFSPEFEGCKRSESIDGVLYIRSGSMFSVIPRAMDFYRKYRSDIDFVVDQCNTHRFFSPLWVEREKRIFFIHQLTREIWFRHSKFPVNIIGHASENSLLRLYKNDFTITVSNSTRKDLVSLGFMPERVSILPEGINFRHFKSDEFLQKENVPTFIYVGRFAKYKGIDDTIEAFCRLKMVFKDAKLWIVGKKDDSYIKNSLSPIISKYGLSYGDPSSGSDIVFWGFVSDEKKLELMSKSHALVFPSIREGWGLIVTESAAVGTPSIAYDSPGIVDAVDYGNAGFLCSENSVAGILSAMNAVIGDKMSYEKMRRNAYEYSLNFHWDNTAKEFEVFMETLVKDVNIHGQLK
ncbi:Glycosyltransferase involved in cell wall bisynthesis [Peptoclostridium litorale DSM 5388]|uniref:Glycosyl transferase group 1 n=1 Tax=Peptoclostridium litorale DSM 5388 TaxID=1121324 RepID=A0A069RF17_PEPLI|nr:glycosyltransferase family 4 protein [Peptoclostridium litorale]KDR95604.1 glycosyl transferase group 1 [Peptoclostridium litorale DSM 5388]SIN99234.1 Glycosyltransferase involved in cell wall bisynthesis [Peptoclostridium litorale DSM 5388]